MVTLIIAMGISLCLCLVIVPLARVLAVRLDWSINPTGTARFIKRRLLFQVGSRC